MTDMAGKVVVITGGNTGIGKEAAVALAGRGAQVVITSRNEERGRSAREEIAERSGNDSVDVMPLDLASFRSIRSFATDALDRFDHLDVLVNNAGLILYRRAETQEGFEETFGVNHLGHFLLTDLLLERLRASAPSRVVVVSSGAHKGARRGLDFDDLQSEHKYKWMNAYNKSKLANIYPGAFTAGRVSTLCVPYTYNALASMSSDGWAERDMKRWLRLWKTAHNWHQPTSIRVPIANCALLYACDRSSDVGQFDHESRQGARR
jgi:short chain dehydrogenase